MELEQLAPVWRDEFDKAFHATKRVLLEKLTDRVSVYPERIEIKMRVRFEDFLKPAYHSPVKPNETILQRL